METVVDIPLTSSDTETPEPDQSTQDESELSEASGPPSSYQWCNMDYRDGGDKRIALKVCLHKKCPWAEETGVCIRIDPNEAKKKAVLELIQKKRIAKRRAGEEE
jgi:hypothetical protein